MNPKVTRPPTKIPNTQLKSHAGIAHSYSSTSPNDGAFSLVPYIHAVAQPDLSFTKQFSSV